MATKGGSVRVFLGIDISELTKGLNKAKYHLRRFSRDLENVGKTLTVRVTAPILAAGAAALKSAADMEKTRVALKQLVGSGEQANRMLAELKDFAATTPFQFPGLVKGVRNMAAFGFETEKLVPTIRTLGDAVAALGGGQFEIERVIRALGQMRAKGKVVAQEINQIAELGIPIREILAEGLGIAVSELETLTQKGLRADKAIEVILQGLDRRFKGSAEVLSRTLGGLFTTLRDEIGFALTDIGENIVEAFDLKNKLRDFISQVRILTSWFRDLDNETKQSIINWALFYASIGPVLVVTSALTKSLAVLLGGIKSIIKIWPKVQAIFLFIAKHPIILAIAAIASSFYTMAKSAKDAARDMAEVNKRAKELDTTVGKLTANLVALNNVDLKSAAKKISEDLFKEGIGKPQIDVDRASKDVQTSIERIREIMGGEGKPVSEILEADDLGKATKLWRNFTPAANEAATATGLFKYGLSDLELQFRTQESTVNSMRESINGIISSYNDAGISISVLKDQADFQDILAQYDAAQGDLDVISQQLEEAAKRAEIAWSNSIGGIAEMLAATMPRLGELLIGVVDQFSAGIGDAFAQAIVYGESLTDSFKAFGKQFAAFLIKTFTQLVIKLIALKILEAAASKAITQSEVSQSAGQTYGFAFASVMKSVPFPANIILAPIIAVAAAASLLAGALGYFAEGGIITGPTLGILGEAGPEAVIPLNRAGGLFGGEMRVTLEVDGDAIAEKIVPRVPSVLQRYGIGS